MCECVCMYRNANKKCKTYIGTIRTQHLCTELTMYTQPLPSHTTPRHAAHLSNEVSDTKQQDQHNGCPVAQTALLDQSGEARVEKEGHKEGGADGDDVLPQELDQQPAVVDLLCKMRKGHRWCTYMAAIGND